MGARLKREAFGHAKFRLVARDLGIPVFAAYGLIASIWNTTSLRFPRGDIGRLSNEEIAAEIEGYDADADQLVQILVKRRLLDEHPQHRLVVHDWSEHADDTVHWKVASIGDGTFADGTESKRRNAKDRRTGRPFRRRESQSHSEPPRHNTENLGDSQSSTETHGDFPNVSVSPSPSPSPSPSHDVVTTCSSDSTVGAGGADDECSSEVDGGIELECGGVAPLIEAPEPPEQPPTQPRPKADSRGTRIPEDFELTSLRRERAIQIGVPPDEVQDTFDEFRDYWRAKAGASARKVSWDLTWDVRCRHVAQRIRETRQRASPRQRFLTAAEKNEAAIAEFEEARRNANRREPSGPDRQEARPSLPRPRVDGGPDAALDGVP